MTRKHPIGWIATGALAGLLALAAPGVSWTDILNTATVSFTDASGRLFAGTSNTWAIAAPATVSLPAPDLGGINGQVYTLADAIEFQYPVSGVTFGWVFAPVSSLTSSPAVSGGGSMINNDMMGPRQGHSGVTANDAAPSATTSAPRFTPAGAGLTPGTYALTVTATQGSQSVSAQARITLVSSNLSAVKVYPNPWRKDKHGTHPITFANLSPNCTVKIFTVSGRQVRELSAPAGIVTWDLATDGGDRAASGIYLYLITDGQGNKVRGKIGVVR
jgi:hypothetical protein